MSRLHPFAFLLAASLLCGAGSAAARHSSHHPRADVHAGAFDYYVMALSWSPTFCEAHADEEEQCAHKGYGFVLHGLWPQYENGGGPQRCPTAAEPDRHTVATTLAFMPSKRLIAHEWHAHGACSGLDAAAYFALADRAFATMRVPQELKAPPADVQMDASSLRRALEHSNPGLRDDMLTLHCSHGELAEVRVCLDKDLAVRHCGKRLRNACPASATFRIPASR